MIMFLLARYSVCDFYARPSKGNADGSATRQPSIEFTRRTEGVSSSREDKLKRTHFALLVACATVLTTAESALAQATPVLTKSFGAPNIIITLGTTLTLSVTNPNSIPLSGVVINDTMPAGLVIATPDGFSATGPCVAGINGIFGGSGAFSYSLAPMAAGATCTFTVNVTGTTAGVKNNTATVASDAGPGNSATASLAVLLLDPPALTKSFGAPNIIITLGTTLTLSVTNPNSIPLSGVVINDTMPAGLVIATPDGFSATGPCVAGINGIFGGSGAFSYALAPMAAGATCTFTVNVTGTTAGIKANTATVTATNASPANPATASLTVLLLDPPVLTKSFGTPNIPINTSTSLTLSVTNPDSIPLSGVVIHDTMPAGLVIATPDGFSATGPCVAGINGIFGGSGAFSYALAPMAAGATCTFTVNVTGTTAGIKANTATVTATNASPANPATASLAVVLDPPVLTKSFGAPNILINTSTSLTLSVTNPNSIPLLGVVIHDTMPAGLVIATPDGFSATGPCVAGINGIFGGSGAFTYALAPLPAGANCTFSVNVTGTTGGVKNNTATVIATDSTPAAPATASLTVLLPPTLSKTFADPVLSFNPTTNLVFTIGNPNASVTLTGVAFTDALPSGLVISTPNGVTATCAGATIAAVPGGSLIDVSGGVLAGGASCTVSVNVTGIADGTQVNTTGPITSSNGGTGTPATATVSVRKYILYLWFFS
uniref:Conserved repeat domain n=1 Tax=Solibacter usitatus (strain Ellin6076) TaxID=234267 RepID=Q01RJ1_SOLUE